MVVLHRLLLCLRGSLHGTITIQSINGCFYLKQLPLNFNASWGISQGCLLGNSGHWDLKIEVFLSHEYESIQ